MDEFEYKFSRRDPVLVINTVKTLVQRLKGYHEDGNKIEYERYYKYLKGKCLQSDNVISSTATDGLLALCEECENGKAVLDVEVLLNDFLTSLQLQNIASVVYLIFNAMDKIDFLKYGIMFNQHPLITILRRDEHSWIPILTNINNSIEYNPDMNLHQKLKPFVLYSLYDYENKVNQLFQQELLQICVKSSNDNPLRKIMLYNKQHLSRTVHYLKQILKNDASLLKPLIICVCEMMKSNIDASEAISILKRETRKIENSDMSIELCLLVDCLQIASLRGLNDILEICLQMMSNCTYSDRALYVLKSALLKCKLNLTTYDNQTRKLITQVDSILTATRKVIPGSETTRRLTLDVDTFINSELLKDTILRNIPELENCSITFLLKTFNYLLSVLYESNDEGTIEILLTILNKCTEKDSLKTGQLLSVVLYKLANCDNPKINFLLLKALPKLATLKENLPLILTTIKTFSVYSPKMQNFALSLHYEIFCVEIRCFNYLQELLVKDVKGSTEENMNYNINKAFVLKELCRKNVHLEVYGSDFAGYISKILSGNRDVENSLVQSLALEGLKHLCRNDIIDIGSAWDSLSVHYENDTRSEVVKSLCDMLSELSNETITDVVQEKLVESVVEKLWNFTTSDDLVIVKAAYEALGQFSLEQVSLGLPEKYMIGSCNAYGNIPGASWINLLSKCRKEELEFASGFLQNLIMAEVRNLKNSVYNVMDGRGEPDKFELHSYSVLAAIFDYVKSKITKWKKTDTAVYLECLRLLSVKYSKPLPPGDWCFLQELLHEKDCLNYCIRIVAHQVILSGTARRLMENYILALMDETNLTSDNLLIYECFIYLSNSIQPIILKPFIAKTLNIALSEYKNGSEKNLEIMLNHLRQVLEESTILDVNKAVIAEEIINHLYKLDYKSRVFDAILTCVHALPVEKLNNISSPFMFVTITPEILLKCLKIRCVAAVNTTGNPFTYLDMFIECPNVKCELSSNTTTRNISFRDLYDWLRLVFVKHRNHNKAVEWLIQLMAKIQLDLADNQNFSTALFKCALFIVAICILSGLDIFRSNFDTFEEYSECFPYALCSILKHDKWTTYSAQVLEWLYEVSTNRTYKRPPEAEHIVTLFKTTLLTSRNKDAFNEKLKWMKYIEVDV